MSRFGNRSIPIISQGPAVPDFSDANAIADVSRAFTAIARGLVVGLNVKTQDTQNKIRQQRIASAIGAQAHEVEMAENRLQREKLDTERIKARMSSEKAKQELDELRRLETNDVLGLMQGLDANQKASFLREHPIYDSEVSAALQDHVAHHLVQSMNTRLLETIQRDATDGNFDSARQPSSYLEGLYREFDVGVLDPKMRAKVDEQMISNASGYMRSQIASQAAQEQAAARQNALASVDQDGPIVLHNILSGTKDADMRAALGPAMQNIENASRVAGQDRTSVTRRFVGGLLDQSIQWVSEHPTDAEQIISGVKAGVGDNEVVRHAMGRARFDDTLRAVAADGLEKLRKAEVAGFTSAVNTEIARANALDDLGRLEALSNRLRSLAPDDIKQNEYVKVFDEVSFHIEAMKKKREGTTAVLAAMEDGTFRQLPTDKRADAMIDGAFVELQKGGMNEFDALKHMVEKTGQVPPSERKAFEDAMVNDPVRAMQIVRAVETKNAPLAERMVAGNETAQDLLNVSRGVPLTDPIVTKSLAVISTPGAIEAMSKAGKLLEPTGLEITTGGESNNANAMASDIAMATGGNADQATPQMYQTYRSAFRIAYAEARQADPQAEEDDVIATARQKARDLIGSSTVNVQGQLIHHDKLSMTRQQVSNRGVVRFVNNEYAKFFYGMFDNDTDSAPTLEFVFPSEGKSYIPAANEIDGITELLEIDPARLESRVLKSGDETFEKIVGMMSEEYEPSDFSPLAPLRWRKEYGTRYVSQSPMTGRMFRAIEDAWRNDPDGGLVPAPPPSEQYDPAQFEQWNAYVEFADRFVMDLGWSGLDAPESPRQQPKKKAMGPSASE